MSKQEVLHTVLKGLTRTELETYAICTALTLFSIVDTFGATAISTGGILEGVLATESERVSLLVRTRVENMLLELN